jgi:hypothetical protein
MKPFLHELWSELKKDYLFFGLWGTCIAGLNLFEDKVAILSISKTEPLSVRLFGDFMPILAFIFVLVSAIAITLAASITGWGKIWQISHHVRLRLRQFLSPMLAFMAGMSVVAVCHYLCVRHGFGGRLAVGSLVLAVELTVLTFFVDVIAQSEEERRTDHLNRGEYESQ